MSVDTRNVLTLRLVLYHLQSPEQKFEFAEFGIFTCRAFRLVLRCLIWDLPMLLSVLSLAKTAGLAFILLSELI